MMNGDVKTTFKEKLHIFQGNSSVVCQETPLGKLQACSAAKSLQFETLLRNTSRLS
jgi:hypothetical protein